jgi:GNAT superfamily N-acetyltransferase
VGRYGFADPPELDSSHYTPPSGIFVVAYSGAAPAGCGSYRWFDQATLTVEIKRLYLVPAVRGHGTGRMLLTWLERHAAAAGAQRFILETAIHNTAALSLFASAGYQPIDSYVPGRDLRVNRAFTRSLTGTP